MKWRPVHAVALALALTGCAVSEPSPSVSEPSPSVSESAPSGLPDDAVITYAFHDSSVPPQYHRSVTLTVSKAESRIVIDSYGEVLADHRVATSDQAWSLLEGTMASVGELVVEQADQGCVGGTSVDLTVMSGDEQILALSPEYCAGANEALEGAIESWITPARDQFPSTDVLAPESG